LIAPANDNAKYYLASLRSLDPKYAGLSVATQDLQDRLLTKARRAASLQQYDAARTWLAEAEGFGSGSVEAAAIRAQIDQAVKLQATAPAAAAVLDPTATVGPPAGALPQPATVSAASLKLLSKVTPVYPTDANVRGISGWVDLEFTVGPDGRVHNVAVTHAEPAGVFDQSAITAVSRWRYAPIVTAGEGMEQRARLRIRFTDPG
jgi:periplasmic protein TonB